MTRQRGRGPTVSLGVEGSAAKDDLPPIREACTLRTLTPNAGSRTARKSQSAVPRGTIHSCSWPVIEGISGRPRYRRIPNVATATDQVDRQFHRHHPDQLWVTDITEHPTREGKVYCAVVLDVFSAGPSGGRSTRRPRLPW